MKNTLCLGDNLEMLTSLRKDYENRIKFVYLDPPYNIGVKSKFYSDRKPLEGWLSFMRERLEALKPLLREDYIIALQIGVENSADAKLLMDGVFGRKHFINSIAVRMSACSGFKLRSVETTILKNVEHIHVYGGDGWTINPIYEKTTYDEHYCSIVEKTQNGKSVLTSLLKVPEICGLFHKNGIKPSTENLVRLYEMSSDFQNFVTENARNIVRRDRCPGKIERDISGSLPFDEVVEVGGYLIYRREKVLYQLLPIADKLHETDSCGRCSVTMSNVLGDWWDGFHLDIGNISKEGGGILFPNGKKPERLLYRLLKMFTKEGDLVADLFAGSGTTPAVATKMGRKWLAFEIGEHGDSICRQRLERIVRGEDKEGISSFPSCGGKEEFVVRN